MPCCNYNSGTTKRLLLPRKGSFSVPMSLNYQEFEVSDVTLWTTGSGHTVSELGLRFLPGARTSDLGLPWSTKLTHNKLGVSFFAEYEQINKETRSRADINLNRLRDQMRSRSEPCLSYSQAHRRSKSNQPNSRCLSPLTPRRLHPSPRVAPPQPIVNPMIKSSRRWSIASHPSSGYMTQNSTPPSYSACSRLVNILAYYRFKSTNTI